MSASFTEIYGRIILGVFVVAVVLAIARAAFSAPVAMTPAEAIETAVARRVGGNVRVQAIDVTTDVAPEPGLQALPDPAARTGQNERFVLMAGKVRRGTAVAKVTIRGTYARAARAIGRDAVLTADDVELVDGEWPPVAMTRLPAPAEVVGLQARRNIAPGETLTSTVLDVAPMVRAGDDVEVTVIVGAVKATGVATASSSGYRGDVIRVTPKEGGRPVRARIVTHGSVEVVQ